MLILIKQSLYYNYFTVMMLRHFCISICSNSKKKEKKEKKIMIVFLSSLQEEKNVRDWLRW